MFIHSQTIQDVDDFASSSEQIWKKMMNYITCSPVDPLQWMGAVRMRVQTADNNITIICKWFTWLQSIKSKVARLWKKRNTKKVFII